MVKHAGASVVSIDIAFTPDRISVAIADNGKGISDADLRKARQENRLGLYGMRERVELLQGSLDIRPAAGSGTALLIMIPLLTGRKGAAS